MSREGEETASLWGGRFEGGMAPAMVPLNLSLDVDGRLWRQDIAGSRGWARALGRAGVLTEAEVSALLAGLDAVATRLESGGIPAGVEDEDIHSLVERLLTEEAGEVALKLHTGRSRNDQVATDLRLWVRDAVSDLDRAITDLGRALLHLAEQGLDVVMPGYTHLQQGQPIRAAHWALAPVWPLLRDRARLRAAAEAAGVLPLGSGAVAGCPFPIDRDALAADLGFSAVTENSLDAISDRDFLADLLYAGALIGVHLSRVAEDLVLFSSAEFAFVRLSDGFSTGSSLMPQKRNPDVAELTRGKTGRLVGNLTGLLTLLKGLPTGYNRDLQEDKSLAFDTVDTLMLVLPALAGAVATARFRPDRIRARLDSQLWATDLADYLVHRGVPFRRSHEAIGRIVRLAEERGVGLQQLSVDDYRSIHPSFEEDVHDLFDWDRSADSRAVPGGTARSAVETQLAAARRALGG
ncbi:argininosuccinate lyase [Gemmatimonadota bacterium Y43]|uniref:argininosuccinate lyase n=1 Tax=Gaopeijia maritima TaxID=3119007 RepID=UPI0032824671